ncbi:MAG: hypothetical protein RIQ89_1571, partial [Bacteroidota bacterium]
MVKYFHTIAKGFQIPMLMVLLFSIKICYAQETKLSLSISSTTVAVGDQFRVEYRLEGNAKNFNGPNFNDFTVVSGPNQSQQTQIVNGNFYQFSAFSYVLQANKEGTFTIPAANVDVGNKKVYSNTAAIKVAKGNPNNPVANASKNVFLKASVDKSSVYQGEGIVVTFKLYYNVNIVNYNFDKAPDFPGFYSQEIKLPNNTPSYKENYDGATFNVAEIKKMVLFPQKSGVLNIEPMGGEIVARIPVKKQRGNDPFDQFFNDPFFGNPFGNSAQDVKVNIASKIIPITVKPLPQPAPVAFNGAIGKYNAQLNLSSDKVKQNDAIDLQFKITGKGNLKLLDPLTLTFPSDFEAFDPKIDQQINISVNGVNGSKSFNYLIIPRTAGNFKIPASEFVYFDIEKGRYETINFPEQNITVLKGDGSPATISNTPAGQTQVKALNDDIRFIKLSKSATTLFNRLKFNDPLFLLLLVMPFALLLGIQLFLFFSKKNESTALLTARAESIAKKKLSLAKKHLDAGKHVDFLNETHLALWQFTALKLNMTTSEITIDNI